MTFSRFLPLAAVLALIAPAAAAADPAPTVKRSIVRKHDLRLPGQEGVLAVVELSPGAREGRHVHPAEVLAYVVEGEITLEVEGEPTTRVQAGGSFYVPANRVHEGINAGPGTAKLVAVFVADKGQPLTRPAP